MKKLIQAIRRSVLAALTLALAFSAAYAVAPVQAATPPPLTSSNSFGFRFVYSQDGKKPDAVNALAVNVVILREGKSVATYNNLRYGDRFTKTLPNSIYSVNIYFHQTGKLFQSINLNHRTSQKDNGLTVVLRLPGTNPPPSPRVIYWVNGVKVK